MVFRPGRRAAPRTWLGHGPRALFNVIDPARRVRLNRLRPRRRCRHGVLSDPYCWDRAFYWEIGFERWPDDRVGLSVVVAVAALAWFTGFHRTECVRLAGAAVVLTILFGGVVSTLSWLSTPPPAPLYKCVGLLNPGRLTWRDRCGPFWTLHHWDFNALARRCGILQS